jgi:hypothetical protein
MNRVMLSPFERFSMPAAVASPIRTGTVSRLGPALQTFVTDARLPVFGDGPDAVVSTDLNATVQTYRIVRGIVLFPPVRASDLRVAHAEQVLASGRFQVPRDSKGAIWGSICQLIQWLFAGPWGRPTRTTQTL